MLQDYKLGIRMLLKFPGLTIAGGLALAIAIGIGAGWYDVWGKIISPAIPLPGGDRIVQIDTLNIRTNGSEQRVMHDFLEWRRELRTIEDLGAYRPATRNLIVGNAVPERIELAELTAAAFRTARVSPVIGRALLDSDEKPGALPVVVIGYDVWQRSFGARRDVIGSIVKLGDVSTTVVGVMPDGFRYPINQNAWTAVQLRASYGALEGTAIAVIGRLAPHVTRARADAELRVLGDRAAAALPATHKDLRPHVLRLGENADFTAFTQFAFTNLPVLLVLIIACMNVGTLVYARTATREGEIAVRSALGASRGRIVGQLFVESLVLTSAAATFGLLGADRLFTWALDQVSAVRGGTPFWITPGLRLTTIFYAYGLAVLSAAMLAVLPALRATSARVQSRLANLGAGGATLRFGRVWTTAMIAQVALTTMAIPVAMESTREAMTKVSTRAEFPSREYLAARIDLERPFEDEAPTAFDARRARTFAGLEHRIAQEPGVVAVTFTDRAVGSAPRTRSAEIAYGPGAGAVFRDLLWTTGVGPGFFEAFDRAIVAGRPFGPGDRSSAARTVIVNEAFARRLSADAGIASPIGARLRYDASGSNTSSTAAEASADKWFEIVGVVRDLGLDPEDRGPCCAEAPSVYHPVSEETVSQFFVNVRVRGNPATLVARLRNIAADVDRGLYVQEARTLEDWMQRRDIVLILPIGALAGVTVLVLFLSALAIFSLLSVSVARRTREIGLRAALGANPRRILAGLLYRAAVLMGSGTAVGGLLLLIFVQSSDDGVALYVWWLAVTSAVMLAAGMLACIGPARRALRINPTEALREV